MGLINNLKIMKKNLLSLLITVFLVNLITVNIATALVQPYSNSSDSRLRALESKQFYHGMNEYESPGTKASRMVMEMTLENAKNERLKEEIKNEIASQNQIKQPIKTSAEICKASMGEDSQYNTLLEKCECVDGYKSFKNKCIDKLEYGIEYCKETVGINSIYDAEKDVCITNEEYCKEKLGDNSKYSIANDQCECMTGFVLSDNICIEERIDKVEIENKPVSISERFVNFLQKLRFW